MVKICPQTKFDEIRSLVSAVENYRKDRQIIPKISFLSSEDLKTDISAKTQK